MKNDRVVLFGAGKLAEQVYKRVGEEKIIAVIDNDEKKQGAKFPMGGNINIISLTDYLAQYRESNILIASQYTDEIIEQLESNKIYNYKIAFEVFQDKDVVTDEEIAHQKWGSYLKKLCDKPGMEVLEVGSRVVTGAYCRDLFMNAEYTGFDYYSGENVDVVGDAHKLSTYFDKKFDLIFSTAVFEHFAMPWQVSLEMIKLLKPGGYVFVETHYSYSSHERPWHFFQYSENALNVLFPEKFGMKCIKKGCSNLLEGKFSEASSDYLQGRIVSGLYCHSEFLGQKVKEVEDEVLSWNNVVLEDVTGSTKYPYKKE